MPALPPATEQAAAAPVVRAAMLLEMDFSSGPVRLWTGLGDLTWAGRTFTGAAALLGLSAVESTAEVRSIVVTVTLSGLPGSAVALLPRDERWQNRRAQIWLALFEPDFVTIAGEPVPVHRGRMDQLSYEEGESASFSLTIESRLVDLERPRLRRYTQADQAAEYPGDLAFEFVESVAAGIDIEGW